MKIAIISDTHDNVKAIDRFIEIASNEKFDAIIHCGDLCGAGLIRKFMELGIPFYYTFGNVDSGSSFELTEWVKGAENIHIFKPFGEVELDGKKIAFVHYIDFAYALCCTKKYNAVFHGHNHRQKKEEVEDCLLVNPGAFFDESEMGYAVYDTQINKVELRSLK